MAEEYIVRCSLLQPLNAIFLPKFELQTIWLITYMYYFNTIHLTLRLRRECIQMFTLGLWSTLIPITFGRYRHDGLRIKLTL